MALGISGRILSHRSDKVAPDRRFLLTACDIIATIRLPQTHCGGRIFMPREIQSATDAELDAHLRILLVGPTGSGKTAQIWTLPGRKFVFVFDPNTLPTLKGCPNTDLVQFLPEVMNVEFALKGFNKDPKTGKQYPGDKSKTPKEPRLYEEWREYFNDFVDRKLYEGYDWICFDSLTFVANAMMDRQLFINNRYGDIEDLGDFRVTGSKMATIFSSIAGLPVNTFCTGHLAIFEDDKTKKIVTQIYLPGKGRTQLPLSHTEVWEAVAGEKAGTFEIKTKPERRGLQEIRTSLKGLEPVEDVTIKDFKNAERFGVGALLAKGKKHAIHNRAA